MKNTLLDEEAVIALYCVQNKISFANQKTFSNAETLLKLINENKITAYLTEATFNTIYELSTSFDEEILKFIAKNIILIDNKANLTKVAKIAYNSMHS